MLANFFREYFWEKILEGWESNPGQLDEKCERYLCAMPTPSQALFLSLQVIIGMMASLITLPPAILLIFIFRKSRVRKLRPSRVDQALKEKRAPVEAQLQAGVLVEAHDEKLNVDSGHGKTWRSIFHKSKYSEKSLERRHVIAQDFNGPSCYSTLKIDQSRRNKSRD